MGWDGAGWDGTGRREVSGAGMAGWTGQIGAARIMLWPRWTRCGEGRAERVSGGHGGIGCMGWGEWTISYLRKETQPQQWPDAKNRNFPTRKVVVLGIKAHVLDLDAV